MGGDGMVSSRYISYGVTTSSTTQSSGFVTLAPAQHSSANDAGGVVIRQYSNYLTTRSKIIYTPAVGTTTTGVVFIAYVDNPEMIYKITSGFYSLTDLTNIVQNLSTTKSTPVWQPLELTLNRPPRRKLFSVDTSFPTSAEIADRTIQGLWLIVTVNAPSSTTVGFISEEYAARGENLQPQNFSGV